MKLKDVNWDNSIALFFKPSKMFLMKVQQSDGNYNHLGFIGSWEKNGNPKQDNYISEGICIYYENIIIPNEGDRKHWQNLVQLLAKKNNVFEVELIELKKLYDVNLKLAIIEETKDVDYDMWGTDSFKDIKK